MIKTNTMQLMEQAVERFQQGGFVNGDYVTVKKNIMSSDYFKNLPSQTQEQIKQYVDSKLNLRVSSINSIRPATQPVDGGLNAAGGFVADIVIEYAPGLYKNPMTIPVEFLDVVASGSQGFGTLPVPEPLKGKSNVHGAKQIEKQSLPTKNTKLPNSNKHSDDQPGGVKKGLYMKDHKAGKMIKDSVDLEDVYGYMLNEQPDNLTPEQEPVVNRLLDNGFRINKISHKFAAEEGGPTVYMSKRVRGGMIHNADVEPTGMVNGSPVDAFLGDIEQDKPEIEIEDLGDDAVNLAKPIKKPFPDWQNRLRKSFETTPSSGKYIMHQKKI